MHRRAFVMVALAFVGASACSSDDGDTTEIAVSTTSEADAISETDTPTPVGADDQPAVDDVPAETAGEPASVDDFCAAIVAIQSAEFALEETFGAEARALFDDVQTAAPPEVADDVATVVDALEAVAEIGISTDENDPVAFDAAAEILLDPAFTDANARLENYTSQACGIELADDSDADVQLDDLTDLDG